MTESFAEAMAPQTTILLVDGSVHSAAWLRNHLEVEGFRVLVAADGPLALDLMRSESPRLVVLCAMALFTDNRSDDGCEAVRLDASQFLQDLHREGSIGVIAISSERSAAKRLKFLDLGVNEHLTWPFTRHRLMACIRNVLRQASNGGREQAHVTEACGELSRD